MSAAIASQLIELQYIVALIQVLNLPLSILCLLSRGGQDLNPCAVARCMDELGLESRSHVIGSHLIAVIVGSHMHHDSMSLIESCTP